MNYAWSKYTRLGTLFLVLACLPVSVMPARAADPSLDAQEVSPPCGREVQIPGLGTPGQGGCSGNYSTSFGIGGVTITYNSQYEGYASASPTLPPSVGFGRGMRATSELVSDGANFKLILSDGSIRRYTKNPRGVWESDQRMQGDLSLIRATATGYELLMQPGTTVISYNAAFGMRYYPTEISGAAGQKTQFLDYSPGPVPIPLTIKDA